MCNKRGRYSNPKRSAGFYLLQQIASCVFVSRKPICDTQIDLKNTPKSYFKIDSMEKKKTGGRNKKSDSKRIFISLRLSDAEAIELNRILNEFSIKNRTKFIKSCIFGEDIQVVKTDVAVMEYWKLLNNLQAEYRAIGNNYNQATKAIKTAFSEKKALNFLYSLVQETRELIAVNNKIIELTEKLHGKWLQK